MQWRIQGRGPEGGWAPPYFLFLDQNETAPTPAPPLYLKVWIRHCDVRNYNSFGEILFENSKFTKNV